MKGYLLTLYTQQDRNHGNEPLPQWLFRQACEMGLRGATLTSGIAGLGHDSVQHVINMFDLSEQPVQMSVVLSEEELERWFQHLSHEKVSVFYTKMPVEFGSLGADA